MRRSPSPMRVGIAGKLTKSMQARRVARLMDKAALGFGFSRATRRTGILCTCQLTPLRWRSAVFPLGSTWWRREPIVFAVARDRHTADGQSGKLISRSEPPVRTVRFLLEASNDRISLRSLRSSTSLVVVGTDRPLCMYHLLVVDGTVPFEEDFLASDSAFRVRVHR